MPKSKLYYILNIVCWLLLPYAISSCDMLPDLRSPRKDFALIVGDISVSMADLEQDREFFSKYLPADFLAGYYETITQQIIYYYILLDYAEKNSILPEEDEDIFAHMFGLFDEGKEIDKNFLRNGVNKKLWHKRVRNMLVCIKALEHIAEGAEAVPAEGVMKYIETNPNFFIEPASVTFQQAIFDNLNDAKRFLSDFKSGLYSDRSISSGKVPSNMETVYNVPIENLPDALANAVFSKSIGEIGEIVKTEYGFHVFKVLHLSEGGPMNKDVAFDMAKSHLDNETKANYVMKQLENMHKHTKIDINKKAIAKLENS